MPRAPFSSARSSARRRSSSRSLLTRRSTRSLFFLLRRPLPRKEDAVRPEKRQLRRTKQTGTPAPPEGAPPKAPPARPPLHLRKTLLLQLVSPKRRRPEFQPVLEPGSEAGTLGKRSWACKAAANEAPRPCLQGARAAAWTAKRPGLQGTGRALTYRAALVPKAHGGSFSPIQGHPDPHPANGAGHPTQAAS